MSVQELRKLGKEYNIRGFSTMPKNQLMSKLEWQLERMERGIQDEKEAERPKRSNKWMDFVRNWANEYDMTYTKAMKDPEVKAAYNEQKKINK